MRELKQTKIAVLLVNSHLLVNFLLQVPIQLSAQHEDKVALDFLAP